MFANRRHSHVSYRIGIDDHDGDVRFQTGSINMAVSRMRNEKICITILTWLKYECPEWLINILGHQPARGWGIMFLCSCATDRLAIYKLTLILSDHNYMFSHCGLCYEADTTERISVLFYFICCIYFLKAAI